MLNKKEGKYEEALVYYKTALQIGKFFFGANHPSIGMYLTNLGDIYRKQGNFNKAEGIYSQVLQMNNLFYDEKKRIEKEWIGIANVGEDIRSEPCRSSRSVE